MTRSRIAQAAAAAAVVVALLGVHSTGCQRCGYDEQCFHGCEADADCDDGFVCANLPEFTRGKQCTKPCASSADCAPCPQCNCRCADDPGKGACDVYTTRSDLNEPGQLCRSDYDRAAACHWLCRFCTCFHGECPGGTSADQCEAECAGAYEAVPGCAQQLDAYYFCGHRSSTCEHGASGYPTFQPSTTCPDEQQALTSCVASTCPSCTWKLFYPTAK